MSLLANEFWKRHPGLVWSNPYAHDSVHIRAALLQPSFMRLLDVAQEFGVARVRGEWNELQTDEGAARVHFTVTRMLDNIEKGFALAARRN